MKRLLLISFVILCLASYGQGQRYVRIVERRSVMPLDSFLVSFVHIDRDTLIYVGESMSDANGLASVPDSFFSGKISGNPTKAADQKKYWPAEAHVTNFTGDTLVIPTDYIIACMPIRPQDIYFAKNKSEIVDFYSDYLKENYLPKLASNPDWTAEIHGNADPHTEHDLAEEIALARAMAVKKWLVKNGIKKRQLLIINDADKDPVARSEDGKDCEAADARNRRVRIYINPSKKFRY